VNVSYQDEDEANRQAAYDECLVLRSDFDYVQLAQQQRIDREDVYESILRLCSWSLVGWLGLLSPNYAIGDQRSSAVFGSSDTVHSSSRSLDQRCARIHPPPQDVDIVSFILKGDGLCREHLKVRMRSADPETAADTGSSRIYPQKSTSV
jgi:hypothetical protein